MTEDEIAGIIHRHLSTNPWSMPSLGAKAAAREITDKVFASLMRAKNPPPSGPNPIYVRPACDCGAERVNPTTPKHAPWCSLFQPSRRH